MPFTIIISEKGGAERRETFDKTEINVGRVQGNDLMLPKGNVSKHHARLLYRDGRFIVTDLKSTNGTYVNGRKITQATIVREGDKIYIGDFILRLDLGGAAAAGEEPPTAVPEDGAPPPMPPGMPPLPPGAGPAGMPPAPPVMQPAMSPHPPPAMQPPPVPMMGAPPPMVQPAMSPMAPPAPPPMPPPMPAPPPAARTVQPAPQPSAVSHYPLERDPDDSEMGAPSPQVPAPPRVPAGPRPLGGTLSMGQQPVPTAQPPQVTRPSAIPPQPPPSSPQGLSRPVPSPSTPSSRLPPKETPQQAGRRLALVTLVDRVADVVTLSALRGPSVEAALVEKVQRAAREQADAMREEGEAPEGVDLDVLVKDAVRELTGLGAIGPLLDDDEVSEIHCLRHDQVLCVRAGQLALADCAYTQDEAVGRAIERLAAMSGQALKEDERIVERRLPKGAHMLAFLPPASSAHAIVIRKRRKVEMSLEDYVRLAAMSRQMANFLEQCLAARANVLVATSNARLGATFVGALANTGSAGDRIALLLDDEDITVSHAHVITLGLGADAGRVLRGAAKLRPDRMVIGCLSGSLVSATIDTIAEGAEGVIACTAAPSLRQALTRLVGQLTMSRPGLSLEAAREVVGESFDVAVELVVLPDGRYRITRIAELAGGDAKGVVARDIFTASTDAPDAGHVATGVVPRVAADFAARGVRMDPNLFKKGR
jgi:pilus assembly protein CpaF